MANRSDRTGAVRIVSGAWDGVFDVAGQSVATVQASLAYPFGIPRTAQAFVNGERVEPSYRLRADDTLEFLLPTGEKGALDPDEKAQLDRIEAAVARLFSDHALAPHRAAAKGVRGRKAETFEVALFANELRLQGKSWKEVLTACKKRWPEDRRVQNGRQIRATWDRHFGNGKKQH